MDLSRLGAFLVSFLQLYQYVLVARVLLSWFPGLDWEKQPWRAIYEATEPVMGPFRRLIPPIGGFDLSPLLLFFGLDLLQQLIAQIL